LVIGIEGIMAGKQENSLATLTEDPLIIFDIAHSKLLAKHRKSALTLRTCHFVLNDIPVLDENSVLDANNVCSNPIRMLAMPGNRPWLMTKSPSAIMMSCLYFSIGCS
jgi:hypothetical protein